MSDELRFPSEMSERDMLLWRLERDPALRSTIVAIALLDKPPDLVQLGGTLQRAIRQIPRLRQRVTPLPLDLAPPLWEEVDTLDLSYHLQRDSVGDDGSLEALLSFAAEVASKPFDSRRPLWEFVLVDNLADGRTALIQKVHHSLTDGIGGVALMQQLYDTRRDAPLSNPKSSPEAEKRPQHDRFIRGTAATLRRFARHTRSVREGLAAGVRPSTLIPGVMDVAAALRSLNRVTAPGASAQCPISRRRSTSVRYHALSVPLGLLREAGRKADCTLNDAFLAALTGGWRRYHEHHGVCVEDLRMGLPVSLRTKESSGIVGNDIMVARIEVPVAETDTAVRMRLLHNRVRELRHEAAIQWAEWIASVANLIPAAVATRTLGSLTKGNDFVASCVPGPPHTLYVGGSRVDALYAFGPPAGAAANMTLFSYGNQAHIGVHLDPAAIPDAETFMGCLEAGFAEVLDLTRPPRRDP